MNITITTSKLILLVDFLIAATLTGIVIYGVFTGMDMTALTVLAGLWDAQLGAAVGVYFWKAKNENRSKYAMQLVRELADRYGIEQVVALAEVVLKD